MTRRTISAAAGALVVGSLVTVGCAPVPDVSQSRSNTVRSVRARTRCSRSTAGVRRAGTAAARDGSGETAGTDWGVPGWATNQDL
jgi:hypothetical protein